MHSVDNHRNMTKQYKIDEEKFFPPNKRIPFGTILFVLISIISLILIALNYQPIYQLRYAVWIFMLIIGSQMIYHYFNNKKIKRNLLSDYNITLEENTIKQTIPAECFLNPHAKPIVKKINYDKISNIKKTGNGTFIIIENEESGVNFITIPAQVQNYEDLEKELNSIYLVTDTAAIDANSLQETFIIPKDGFKRFQFYFLTRLIPFALVIFGMIIALIYVQNNAIQWAPLLTIFGSAFVIVIFIFLGILKITQARYDGYRFTIDKHVMIQEWKKGVVVIPIDRLIKIKKVVGNILNIQGSSDFMDNKLYMDVIPIYAEVENREALEKKLNSIMPIGQRTYLI